MIHKVLVDCEITVFENEDDAGEWRNGKTEVFKAGETVDFDIIGHPLMLDFDESGRWVEDKNEINVQFGDGSVATCLDKDWFELVE